MNSVMHDIWKLIFWLCLLGTVYTYFLYPFLLKVLSGIFGRRYRHKTKSISLYQLDDNLLPTVTMVVSAYNEAEVLPDKLANCMSLDYPADKISFLIGSDGSDDDTNRILRCLEDERFRTWHSRIRSGKVSMLNRLLKMVTSDIVVFSDANTMFHPQAIRNLVYPFAQTDVGCVNGKLELIADASDIHACQPEGIYWRYENRLKQMESVLGAVPSINGGIFAIRRHLYEELPEHAVTEDQVLGMRIMVRGYRCVFAQAARACESVSSWSGELRRRIRISAGNFQSLFLVPAILNPFRGFRRRGDSGDTNAHNKKLLGSKASCIDKRLTRIWVSFAFISHKLLRWLVPFFLTGMLCANVLLAGEAFYGSTLFLQGLFYICGLIGALLTKLGTLPKVLTLPKYFIAMNAAILLGLARFLMRRQQTTWAKTPRR